MSSAMIVQFFMRKKEIRCVQGEFQSLSATLYWKVLEVCLHSVPSSDSKFIRVSGALLSSS